MAEFGYEAINDAGKTIKGSIEADSIENAKTELRNRGLSVLVINEQTMFSKDLSLDFGSKPTPRDMSVFCRQFVSMTKAGVSIIDALKMLEEQTENKRLKKAVRETRINVEKGDSLATSMALQPKVFPSLMIHLIQAGEASGNIDTSMERMAIQFEKTAKTKALVKKAMIYPSVIAVVAVAVVVVMLVLVIPSYTDMFADLGTELPGITLAVVAASDFVMANWLVLLILVLAAVFGLRYFTKTAVGKRTFGFIALKLPVFRNLTVKSSAALMARTLSTLLASGVSLTESVEIASDTMENLYFKDALKQAAEQITVGVALSQPLETCGLFPPMVYHMVRIGEESGNTEEMLTKLADYYDEEVEEATQAVMAFLEPIIILLMAAIVLVLIGSVLAPMLTMYDALDAL